MRVEDYAFLLCLNPLAIRVVMTRLINAIAQNEAKLRIPMETNMFHLFAPRKSPNIERGTAIPTSMDKPSVVLKDPKGPLFTLLSLLLFPYKGSCNLLEGFRSTSKTRYLNRVNPVLLFCSSGCLIPPSLLVRYSYYLHSLIFFIHGTTGSFVLPIPPEATADSGLLYYQLFSHETSSIQHGDGSPSFLLGRHLHEGKPSRLAGLSVLYNLNGHDISRTGEEGFEFVFSSLGSKITYVNFPIHFFSLFYITP